MKLEEALPELRKGKPLNRWSGEHWKYIYPDYCNELYPMDLLADDWEVVDE